MHEKLVELDQHRSAFLDELSGISALDSLEQLRVKYIGRKGLIAGLFKEVGKLPNEVKGPFGKALNELKTLATEQIEAAQQRLEGEQIRTEVDLTLPARLPRTGSYHPLALVEREVRKIFQRMGFTVERGPEIEDAWHLFDALNTPEWHPAREPTDTFYLEEGGILRTETSPIQIRVMERDKPPIRIIAPGKTYRNDKPDATHSPMFSQVEGLYVDKGVTMADLKGTVLAFYRAFFGSSVKTRFRPHFFPFTEPSAEVDITCAFCGGNGCRVCKGSGWIEMGGCGMVDPNVFDAVGIDSEVYTGWAFGLGIERLSMLAYDINDIRLFHENDYRFLGQFGGRR